MEQAEFALKIVGPGNTSYNCEKHGKSIPMIEFAPVFNENEGFCAFCIKEFLMGAGIGRVKEKQKPMEIVEPQTNVVELKKPNETLSKEIKEKNGKQI